MRFLHLCLLGQLAGLSIAHPSISTVVTPKHKSTRLSNEPLSQDLNYLKDELIAHMPATNATALQWEGGWLPKDCQDQMVGKYNVSASDIEVYNVTFDDCSAPWIMCRSKDSQQPVEELILDFSRIPVRARSYVKHVISVPDKTQTAGYAYMASGTITMVNKFCFSTMLHETGHSLDFHGAYSQYPTSLFSDSELWHSAVGNDSNVPDNYAGSNYMEDLAQSTVVATFDLNVPGGFRRFQNDWQFVEHQYTMVQQQLGVMLAPGGFCTTRLTNSVVVPVPLSGLNSTSGANSTLQRRTGRTPPPDVSLPGGITEIQPTEHSTEEACRHTS